MRPFYGVLDVLLNDASLGIFNIVHIPGSNGYSSVVVPLLEAFGCYNIKTQYQYREDISKAYDNILLDIEPRLGLPDFSVSLQFRFLLQF